MGGVFDQNRFESALVRPQQSVFGEEAFPTVPDKAAALVHAFIKWHPFVNGNKRTALLCGAVFLQLNGWELQVDWRQAVQMTLDVESGQMSLDDLRAWFADPRNAQPQPQQLRLPIDDIIMD